jgi:hypothetical protein
MTQRERQAMAGSSAPVPAPGSADRPRPLPSLNNPGTPSWEDFFFNTSPQQQKELLALASRQGIVYQHQLSAIVNGTGNGRVHIISQLLAGQHGSFEPVRGQCLDWVDSALDDAQRAAVAAALATPDLCLIQGHAGTGKSRVVAEIVTQAALAGQRTLLLASHTAALDRVLEQVGSRLVLFPIRCLAPRERLEELPPEIRSLTFEQRIQHLQQTARKAACQQVAKEEHRRERLGQSDAVWKRLQELAEQCEQLAAAREQLVKERGHIPDQIETEARDMESSGKGAGDDAFRLALSGYLTDCRSARERIDLLLGDLRQHAAQQRDELSKVLCELDKLNPLVESKRLGHWWSWHWWRAIFQGSKLLARKANLDERRSAMETALADKVTEERELTQERDQAEQKYRAQRARACAEENARRTQLLSAREIELEQSAVVLQQNWQALVLELDPETPPPTGQTVAAVQTAREVHVRCYEQTEQNTSFAREWAVALEQQAQTIPERLLAHANLVAATTAAIGSDAQYGEGSVAGWNFDVLVLEEAHLLNETELLRFARRARRWILVGEPTAAEASSSREQSATLRKRNSDSSGRLDANAAGPKAATQQRLFHRLWEQLHLEPRRLPYSWWQENGHWCCRLRSLTPDQRRHLECERVADCPEIELRILATPGLEPALAEVVFPSAMSLAQAKQFIFRELQELAAQAQGSSFCWLEHPDRLVLRLSVTATAAETTPVMLDSGVHEMVGQAASAVNGDTKKLSAGYTSCLEFDRSAGWDRPRAEDWVQRYLRIRNLGRTYCLDAVHRMQADLAAIVADLFGDNRRPCSVTGPLSANGHKAAVEFVSVTPASDNGDSNKATNGSQARRDNGRHSARGDRLRAPKEPGIGLEINLADPRQRERLPEDLRAALPQQGLVNWIEAQSIIRTLENLVTEHATEPSSTVGVMSLYPAQVALLGYLIGRSPLLNSRRLCIAVGEPSAFREREFATVLLGLTRSHGQRAVSYGPDWQSVGLALTRARTKLIIFGDPDTLARRSQWKGAVDHLDESAAQRERGLASRLVGYLHGKGAHTRAFLLREGNSP